MIKEYFANYFLHMSDVTFDLRRTRWRSTSNTPSPGVTLVDTGDDTMTGGRLQARADYVDGRDVLLHLRRRRGRRRYRRADRLPSRQGKLATLTAVQPPGASARSTSTETRSRDFEEKPHGDGGWINGGFFVLEPEVFDYIEGDATSGSASRSRGSRADGQLAAFHHTASGSRWTRCATRSYLEELWASGARRGTCGDESRLLARTPGLRHRPHRIQRHVADGVADDSRRARDRLLADRTIDVSAICDVAVVRTESWRRPNPKS